MKTPSFSGTEGILVLDDDPGVRTALQRLLRAGGFTNVLTADNGVEAASLLADHGADVHVVLVDLSIPKVNGFSFIEHITNIHPHVVGVIVVTGHQEILSVQEFRGMGSDLVLALDYLSKPVDESELLRHVQSAVCSVQHKRLILASSESRLATRLARVEERLDELLLQTRRLHRGLAAELGMDLLRALLIAAAILALLNLEIGEFVRHLLQRLK
jgi:CheY-like chemotaxis protein